MHATKTSRVEARSPALADLDDALADRQEQLRLAHRRIESLDRRVAELTRRVERERQHAYYDELTGLPNRRLLIDRVNQAIARSARQGKPLAVLFLDLDGFKSINDGLGHEVGDRLLKQVATRVGTRIRSSDTACRCGGDEFVVVLSDIEHREGACRAMEKIRNCIAKPYVFDGKSVRMTVSIGMAMHPEDGDDYAQLIVHADRAMYEDKARRAPLAGAAPAPGSA
jgi:diguanylate cyclase (GGDEF)-like protein